MQIKLCRDGPVQTAEENHILPLDMGMEGDSPARMGRADRQPDQLCPQFSDAAPFRGHRQT